MGHFPFPSELFLPLSLLFGAIIGSFLTMLVYRLPRMMEQQWREECRSLLEQPEPFPQKPKENLVWPRSHCPHCKTPLKIWQNLPLFGYLLQRGKCHFCGEKIPIRYFLIEVFSVGIAGLATLHFSATITAIYAMIFGWILIALAFIDAEHQLLPDSLTYPLLWLGLPINLNHTFAPIDDVIWGAVAGYLLLWGISKSYKLLRGREGIGLGDAKLLAALGAWFGWQMLPLILLIAAVTALLIALPMILLNQRGASQNQSPNQIEALQFSSIPFGPFLAISGGLLLFWGTEIQQWLFLA